MRSASARVIDDSKRVPATSRINEDAVVEPLRFRFIIVFGGKGHGCSCDDEFERYAERYEVGFFRE